MAEADGGIARLLGIMATLRDPRTGCPWDVRQDFASIAPVHHRGSLRSRRRDRPRRFDDLREELGDLLLQVVFHARMAEEQGAFAFADVVAAISDKMQRRHPHVFAGATVEDAEAQAREWRNTSAANARPPVMRILPRSPASPAACRNGSAR